ncbi:MAG: sialate O-acetylesterase [Alloprevotella sp.]|nr:sialate O-acetylesterase [Alloprevotella sp.]
MYRFLLLIFTLMSCICTQAQQRIKVACVGNSVTYGMKLEHREVESYPAQLQQMLGENYEVRNFGHNGATLLRHGHNPYTLLDEYKSAVEYQPDIVVIHLGLNDTDPRNWPDYSDEFDRDYSALIDTFRISNPHAKVYVCLLTPIHHRHPRFQSGTRDWHYAIRQHIRRLAEAKGATLIDLYSPLHKRTDLFPDAIHPNAEGAGIIAKTVYGALSGDYGGLQLPRLFSDGMVLQRHRPLSFYGTANAGQRVKVVFNGKKASAVANPQGRWHVTFSPMEAGGPFTATISTSDSTLTLRDVYVGEVWLCSGQSNMEYTLSQASTASEDIKASASQPLVHLYNLTARYRTDAVEWTPEQLDNVNRLEYMQTDGWETASPTNVGGFSAIGYHFARTLADSLQIPVGVICNAVGGATTESYIDRETLEWELPAILYSWADGDFGQPWARGRMKQNIAQSTHPLQRHPYEPAYLFEAAMLPLRGYDIAGVCWYQGESNAHNVELHERLFSLLEQSWRNFFHNPSLPFYFVQLSSLNRPSWPAFRDSQRLLATTLPHTWMAVSSDVGDSLDVHYPNKRPVGQRLAYLALRHNYRHTLEAQGPTPLRAYARGNKIEVVFSHAQGMRASDGLLRGFELAGADGVFYPARCRIEGEQIVIWNQEIRHPQFVRYGWEPFTRANLINNAGLPASTFLLETTERR